MCKFRCYMHKSRVRNIQNFCSRSIEAPNPSRGGHAFQSTTRALHRESSVNKPVSIPKPDNSRDNSPLLSPFVYMMYIYIYTWNTDARKGRIFFADHPCFIKLELCRPPLPCSRTTWSDRE